MPPADPTDRKAMLRAAYDDATTDDETPTPEVEEAPEPAPEPEQAAETEGDEPAREGRDDKGRFAPKAKDAPEPTARAAPARTAPALKPKAAPAAPVAPAAVAPTAPPAAPAGPGADLKPPQSWTPAAREAWKDVPPAARQEIHRLEGETRRVLQEAAGLRKQHAEATQRYGQIEQGLRPFEGIFRAQGQDPMSGAMSVVQTYAALHYGSQQQKDGILAGLIQQFGSIDGLNAHLEGKAAPAGAPAPQPATRQAPSVDPRAIIREEFQALQQQAMSQRAERDFDAFAASQPEFLNDVWEDMQGLLEVGAQRGRNLTYEQAYDRACLMNDEIQAIVKQRADAAAATAQPSAPAQRARVASATVRSRPASAVGVPADPNDRRAMLQRAYSGA